MFSVNPCLQCNDRPVEVVVDESGDSFTDFCSLDCCEAFHAAEEDADGEPMGSHDLSDDGDALASAGFGTDEDYGYYGDGEY